MAVRVDAVPAVLLGETAGVPSRAAPSFSDAGVTVEVSTPSSIRDLDSMRITENSSTKGPTRKIGPEWPRLSWQKYRWIRETRIDATNPEITSFQPKYGQLPKLFPFANWSPDGVILLL